MLTGPSPRRRGTLLFLACSRGGVVLCAAWSERGGMTWDPQQQPYGQQGFGAPPGPPPGWQPSTPKPKGMSGTALAILLGSILWGSCGLFVTAKVVTVRQERAEREDADWKSASASLAACRAPVTSKDCEAIFDFLAKWPNGQHATIARTALDGSRARLDELEREELQRSTQWPPPNSGKPKKIDPRVKCNDGTYSPSCTINSPSSRGCCSGHGGIY